MSKPKDILVAVRFTPSVMERVKWVSDSAGHTSSKWLYGLAMAELDRLGARIGGRQEEPICVQCHASHGLTIAFSRCNIHNPSAAMPGQLKEQDQPQPPTPAPASPAEVQLSGHGGEGNGVRSAPMVSTPPAPAANPGAVVSTRPVVPKWVARPKPAIPAWNPTGVRPTTVAVEAGSIGGPQTQGGQQATATEPSPASETIKTYACPECKDEGAGVLVECHCCGRYRDQQGKVITNPDFHRPRDWGAAFALMEAMDHVERAEKFSEWSDGQKLPEGWRELTREAKISWLNLTCPLA